MKTLSFLFIACVCSFFTVALRAAAAPSTQPTEFLRFVENRDGSARLEAADVAYVNGDGVGVHLVGAVHIADPSFFAGLDESFAHYDALLYEMVKSKDAAAPMKGQQSGSWVSRLQRFMKDRLDLVFQLDAVNYQRPNFVHADLDYETFEKMQDERGESVFSLMLRAALNDMAKGQP